MNPTARPLSELLAGIAPADALGACGDIVVRGLTLD